MDTLEKLRERQLMIEKLSDNIEQGIRLRAIREAISDGKILSLPHTQRVMADNIHTLMQQINLIKEMSGNASIAKKYISQIKSDVLAFITLDSIVSTYFNKGRFNTQTLSRMIGKLVLIQLKIEKGDSDAVLEANIGKALMECAIDIGIIHLNNNTAVLNNDILEYILQYDVNEMNNVYALPYSTMVCPPDDWTTTTDGGFLTKERKRILPLISYGGRHPSVKRSMEQRLTVNNAPMVFSAANYLQSIPLTIDKSVLNELDERGGDFGIDKQALRLTMSSAGVCEGEVFWLPCFFDVRGRVYYRSGINPQGNDASKALIDFHKEEKLTDRGVYWVKVALANALGYDKARLDIRVAYVDNMDGASLYSQCRNNILATKYLNILQNNNTPTGAGCHVDAACNGISHFSALLRDETGAGYTNLVDNGEDYKSDIYQATLDKALELINNSNNDKAKEAREIFKQHPLNRAIVKRIVMCFVYSLSGSGAMKYVMEGYKEEYSISISAKTAYYIGQKLFESLQILVPKACEAMEWLKKNVQRHWQSPVGFTAWNDYRIEKKHRIEYTLYGNKRKTMTIVKPTDRLNNRKMRTAYCPNYIHSIDSSHLIRVVNRCKEEGIQLQVIHDSFLTHFNHMDRLSVILREEFYRLHNNYTFPGVECGDIEPGNLDLSKVIKAEFMFS